MDCWLLVIKATGEVLMPDAGLNFCKKVGVVRGAFISDYVENFATCLVRYPMVMVAHIVARISTCYDSFTVSFAMPTAAMLSANIGVGCCG